MTQTCTLHIKKGTRQGEALQMMAHCANKTLSVVGHIRTEGFEKAVPFGDLPALEIDLQMYSQVVPIQRFYGMVCGFVPTDPVEVRKHFNTGHEIVILVPHWLITGHVT
eukprot:sb/3477459/